jgi:hypothetical protein
VIVPVAAAVGWVIALGGAVSGRVSVDGIGEALRAADAVADGLAGAATGFGR